MQSLGLGALKHRLAALEMDRQTFDVVRLRGHREFEEAPAGLRRTDVAHVDVVANLVDADDQLRAIVALVRILPEVISRP